MPTKVYSWITGGGGQTDELDISEELETSKELENSNELETSVELESSEKLETSNALEISDELDAFIELVASNWDEEMGVSIEFGFSSMTLQEKCKTTMHNGPIHLKPMISSFVLM